MHNQETKSPWLSIIKYLVFIVTRVSNFIIRRYSQMGAPKVSNGKVIREPLLTREFWSRTFTQSIHAAAAGALSIFTNKEFNLIHGGSWAALAVGAATGLIGSVLLSLTSQGVP